MLGLLSRSISTSIAKRLFTIWLSMFDHIFLLYIAYYSFEPFNIICDSYLACIPAACQAFFKTQKEFYHLRYWMCISAGSWFTSFYSEHMNRSNPFAVCSHTHVLQISCQRLSKAKAEFLAPVLTTLTSLWCRYGGRSLMIFAGLEWLRHWPHSVFSGPERILTHTLVTGHSGLVVTFNRGFQWIVLYLTCWG